MNASVAIQSLPDAANDEELIRIVDEVIAYIKSTGVYYGENVPLFRRNGYQKSGAMIP